MRGSLSFARVARIVLASCAVVCLGALMGCHVGAAMAIAGSSYDQSPYEAEAIATKLGAGAVRTLGCLDVGLAIYERDEKELLDVHIGNRCIQPEALDLGKLAIKGTDPAGLSRSVTLYDPKTELVPLHVGGAERGRERFRMENAHGLSRLCFDLQAIAPDAPAARPTPLCFERRTGWHPVSGGLT